MPASCRSLLVVALMFLAACGGGNTGNGGTGGGDGGGTGGGSAGGAGGGDGGGAGGGTGSCTDDCTQTGGTVCSSGTSYQLCGQFDSDSCLDLATTVFNCTGNQVCQNGSCQSPDAGSCSDDCAQSGAVVCDGTSGTRTCGQYDSDSCLDLSAPQACPSGQQCAGGICTPSTSCTNDCGPFGTKQCDVTNGFRTCGNYDSDSCLEWSTVTACTRTEACSGGSCTTICTDDCSTGTQTCSSSSEVKTCGNYDSDPCYEYSQPTACNSNQNCVNNVCTACTNECPTSGQGQCEATGDAGFRTCGNFDSDSCFEWSTSVTFCPSGQVCYSGACSVPCTDECSNQGKTQCSGSQVQTCGNYDGDSCLEWSTAAACTNGGTCSAGICQAPNAPDTRLLTPQGTVQSTQGKVHNMLVDATPAAGRSITKVEYFANDVKQGETTTSPHSFNYTVPTTAATNSTITLQAQAIDNQGTRGYSQFAFLSVKNDLPVATFTATIVSANQVQVDASAVTDTETLTSALQVCFDWQNDGNCDTAYSTTKVATHDFGTAGTYTILMKVKDGAGQISQTTRQVTFQNIQYIGGTVTTTTWYGTIVVTGDINVASGNTLTISAGTQVLFVRTDQDNNGVGDYGINIAGKLEIQGTATNPVLFTSYQATQPDGGVATRTAGSWDRVTVAGGQGSTIDNAIFEYGFIGLEIKGASGTGATGTTVTNTIIRNAMWDCLNLENADNAAFTNLTVTQCTRAGASIHSDTRGVTFDQSNFTSNGMMGIWQNNAGTTITNSLFKSNTEEGADISNGSTFNISDSTVELNGQSGLRYVGNSGGTLTRNQIRQNGMEGVGLVSDATGDPNPVANLNNIYSNATTGSNTSSFANPGLSASWSGTTSAGAYSSIYTAPAGKTISRIYVTFNEYYNTTYSYGRVVDGSTNAQLAYIEYSGSGWYYLPAGTTSVRLHVADTYTSNTDSISASQVDLAGTNGTTDISAATLSGTANFKNNYLGTWPYVLNRISMSRNTAFDVQGFVGAPFDSTWSRGPYKAGTVNSESWSGTIFITGDVNIPAGQTVTVAPGTNVEFVKHDQNGDGNGDFTLTAAGKLAANGTSASRVNFRSHASATGNAFQRILLSGANTDASAFTETNVTNGYTALELRGNSTLDKVSVTGGSYDAVYLNGGSGASLTDLVISGGSRIGVAMNNADNVTFTRPDIQNTAWACIDANGGSTGWTVSKALLKGCGAGIYITNGSNGTVLDSTIRDNNGAGVYVENSSPTVNYNLITYNNGAGLNIQGSGTTTAQYNVIKFNNDVGVTIWTQASGSPTPTVQYSNIYGNAVTGSFTSTFVNPSLSASWSGTTSAGAYSGTYTAPANTFIRRIYVTFSEYYNTTYSYGRILDASNNVLAYIEYSGSGWYYLPWGTTAVKLHVGDTYTSNTDSISASNLEYMGSVATDKYELFAATDTGTSLAKFNYWTANIADVPNKVRETRTNSVDYSSYTGAEYPNTQVTQVGPRP